MKAQVLSVVFMLNHGTCVFPGVSWWGHKVDNAYWIWNFQGRLLHKQPKERFCQLLWRPRPKSLLTKDQLSVSNLCVSVCV